MFFLMVDDVNETPVRKLCMVVVVVMSLSPDLVNHISSNFLEVFHAFSRLLPSPPPKYHNMSSIDYHDMFE